MITSKWLFKPLSVKTGNINRTDYRWTLDNGSVLTCYSPFFITINHYRFICRECTINKMLIRFRKEASLFLSSPCNWHQRHATYMALLPFKKGRTLLLNRELSDTTSYECTLQHLHVLLLNEQSSHMQPLKCLLNKHLWCGAHNSTIKYVADQFWKIKIFYVNILSNT